MVVREKGIYAELKGRLRDVKERRISALCKVFEEGNETG